MTVSPLFHATALGCAKMFAILAGAFVVLWIVQCITRAPVLDDDDRAGLSDAELHDADLMEGEAA